MMNDDDGVACVCVTEGVSAAAMRLVANAVVVVQLVHSSHVNNDCCQEADN